MKDGYAFIQFEDLDSAVDAVKETNRSNVFGQGNINVEFAKVNNRYQNNGRMGGGSAGFRGDDRGDDRG